MHSIATASLTTYWKELEVRDQDLEFIYNLLLERGVPLTTREMAEALIEHRIERLEADAREAPPSMVDLYRPCEVYAIGDVVLFSALGSVKGKVVGIRPGENPDTGPFDVIQVEFQPGQQREFASRLPEHKLNRPPEPDPAQAAASTPAAIISTYGRSVEDKLSSRLAQAPDIVRIAGRWFPKALLADINVGHLNIAEAVLDVANGGPLPTPALMEHLEVPPGVDPSLAEFSLDYALQEDPRFDEVGPAGKILWYLRRLEPTEVLYVPPRLEYTPVPHDRSRLTPALLSLEAELDDEHSPAEAPQETIDEVTVSLLFPHWRVGTLPLSSRLRPLFPTAYEAPRIRFIMIDGQTGEDFPAWVVRAEKYVYGLDEWYRRHQVPAGGLIRLRQGENPGEVMVEAVDRRRRNEWMRTLTVGASGQIGFTMLKQGVGAAYDELMVVGLVDRVALDEAWLKGPQRHMTTEQLVAQVFRELAKLNPQSAVHAQALYSGVNTIRRLPPAVVFAELVSRPHYVHVGDLYWRFAEAGSG